VSPAIVIRQLQPGDVEAYRALRLAALAESPEAFGSDVGTESASPVEAFAHTLRSGYVAGAFAGEQLVAIAGFRAMDREKMRHRGDIWGVYVAPDARGTGVGRRVMEHILEHARSGRGGGRRRCGDAVCRVRGDGTGLRDLDNVWERHMPCERA